MYSLSSPLTPEGLLKLNTTTTILLVILFTLYITSCEACHLRVNGKYSSKKSSLPAKDVTEVGASKNQIRASLMLHNMALDQETQVGGKIDRSIGTEVLVKVKKEVASSDGAQNARLVVRVLQQLPHREHKDDQGIHLDYAQPRTHTPGDSSRHSLRRRFEGIESATMAAEGKQQLRSFVEVPRDSHFPIQNLPFGVIRWRGSPESRPRPAVAIGDFAGDRDSQIQINNRDSQIQINSPTAYL